jgi:type I restriction enzyme, S subunit
VSDFQTTDYGNFLADYAIDALADLCDPETGIQTGPFGSLLHKEDYVEVGTPIITVEHLDENRIRADDSPCVSEDDYQRLSKFQLRTGDIVFSRVGSVDRRALVRDTEDGWLFSGRCLRVRPDASKIDPLYLSYFFGLPSFKKYIRAIAVGATMPSLNTKILSNIPVPYPRDVNEQRAIAHILGSLDDKIELNRRMNATLEGIARALFKSWFVDFDPVHARRGERESTLPPEVLALFPAAFEESELGPIPVGWETGTFGEIAKNLRRNVDPDDWPPHTPYIGLGHMPQQSIALTEWGESQEVGSTKRQFKQGEILFGKLRPYFHKVGIAPVDGICSTDIVVAMPRQPVWYAYTLEHLSSSEFIDYTTAVSTGTKMPRTKWRDMKQYEIVVPPKEIALIFNQSVEPMFNRIQHNILESRTLADMRDTLLPRLISGELRVHSSYIAKQ